MIIIPNAKAIVILPPRTGSTSLKNYILSPETGIPGSFLLYRHMEADGVPAGYEGWLKVGLVRKPIDRLWSIYRYCHEISKHDKGSWSGERVRNLSEDVQSKSFDEWLDHPRNELFAIGLDMLGNMHPRYHVLHPSPENRKSQMTYLRPDKGTQIWAMEKSRELLEVLYDRARQPFNPKAPMKKLNSSDQREKDPKDSVWSLSSPDLAIRFPHLVWDAAAAGGWF